MARKLSLCINSSAIGAPAARCGTFPQLLNLQIVQVLPLRENSGSAAFEKKATKI